MQSNQLKINLKYPCPFGVTLKNRDFTSEDYRYGFNGMEKDDEVKGNGNSYDFGARMLDPRLGRWQIMDKYSHIYTSDSPYGYSLNCPISAVDLEGDLVLFIGGLRLYQADRDQSQSKNAGNLGGKTGIYDYDATEYWCTEENTFGESVDMAGMFTERLQDENAWYTSGSSAWKSQASERKEEGKTKAEEFHAMVESGEIKLEDCETIKIVAHSQGAAHAEGFAEQLLSYKDANGDPLYKIEIMYNITPHQPTDIEVPGGVPKSVQYSHPNDAISSDSPKILPNGGSQLGPIKGVTEYDERDILGGDGQPKAEGPAGNRGGHNVNDNNFIFTIPSGEPGYVAPREDKSEKQ